MVRPCMGFCVCFLALQYKGDTDTAEGVCKYVFLWIFPNIVLKAALQAHDVWHFCLIPCQLETHSMNLHLPFSGFGSGKKLDSNLRGVYLMLVCKDKYPMHSAQCKNSFGSTCKSGFAQIICGVLGLTLLFIHKTRMGQSRADCYGIT